MEYTLYYINSYNGVDGPPYKVEHDVPDGVPIAHPSDVVDDQGNTLITRAISQKEFEEYWESEEKNNIKLAKKVAKTKKENEEKHKALTQSVIKKLTSGEKLTQEEAELIVGSLGA